MKFDPELLELLSEDFIPMDVTPALTPEWDEDEKAHKARQGRVGISRREGLRKKTFRTPSDLQWPIPYRWMPWLEWESELSSYLAGLALREMKRLDSKAGSRNDDILAKRIAKAVYAVADQQGAAYLTWDKVKPMASSIHVGGGIKLPLFTGTLSRLDLSRKAEEAVVYAFEVWRDDYYADRTEWGRKGGKLSKRPKKYTYELLDDIAHLSIPEQADALGCSTATVGRLRREKALSNKPAEDVEAPTTPLSNKPRRRPTASPSRRRVTTNATTATRS